MHSCFADHFACSTALALIARRLTDWLVMRAVRVTRDGVLVVEGERKQEEEKEENGFKRFERVYGQFVRRFRLVRWPVAAPGRHALWLPCAHHACFLWQINVLPGFESAFSHCMHEIAV